MRTYRLDKNGVPILSRIDIELRAEKFLRYFDSKCLEEPCCTPIATISSKLRDDFGLNFIFDADLGLSPEGYRYRGRFHIPSKTIFIDQTISSDDPRFNFTLAHEIAHFVLHRRIQRAILTTEKDLEISDTSRQLILDKIQGDNPRTWVEWQANKFASSLLLPRFTVPKAIVKKQRDMGMTRNVGNIYLDRQSQNFKDFKEIIDFLQLVYQTSKSSIRIRLLELNILIETQKPASQKTSEPENLKNILARFFDSSIEQ